MHILFVVNERDVPKPRDGARGRGRRIPLYRDAARGSLFVFGARRVSCAGAEVSLPERDTGSEPFAHSSERVFSGDARCDCIFPEAGSGHCWGHCSGHRVMRGYFRQLREKHRKGVIETVPGGYRLGV